MSVEITLNYAADRIVAVGASGPAGPANTLTIGTVTTVAAGGSATASVGGTAPAQTLNLGIPTGATGQGFLWRGAWATGVVYAIYDVVRYAGSSYRCSTAHTSGTDTPPVATGFWSLMAQAGADGTNGTNGTNGDWSTAQTLNAQTGTSYTIVSGDVGKLVTLTNAAAIALTVPTGVATVGQRIDLAQLGAGQVTVGAGSGVTILSTPTAKLRTQNSAATLICTATTGAPTATFLLVGDLAAV